MNQSQQCFNPFLKEKEKIQRSEVQKLVRSHQFYTDWLFSIENTLQFRKAESYLVLVLSFDFQLVLPALKIQMMSRLEFYASYCFVGCNLVKAEIEKNL